MILNRSSEGALEVQHSVLPSRCNTTHTVDRGVVVLNTIYTVL